ncbi:MAG: hypothetical protein P8X82_13455, partial [Gemmatimonadales bacterium]
MRKTLLFLLWISSLSAQPSATVAQRPTLDTHLPTHDRPMPRMPEPGLAKVDSCFYLYGGPGTDEGKFQNIVTPTRQGWIGVDVTETPSYWQISTTCADSLGNHGPGNEAYWAGQTAVQQPDWATPPGYGNSWNVALEWRTTVSNPALPQVVSLEFVFNHDLEPGYDYFIVEYDSASVTKTVYSVSGTSALAAPGVVYPDDVASASITYGPNGYSGPGNDEIVLRLRVTSDGIYSDQDGLWDSSCGAVQIDDITVSWTDGGPMIEAADMDNTTGSWVPIPAPFAGDFSKVFLMPNDIDPFTTNVTPAMGFIDDGTPPSNSPLSTGGSTSVNWTYGPGSWVVNYTDGVSGGTEALNNEVWSPPIAWDLPGTADDDPFVAGSHLGFRVWNHLPQDNGIFYYWGIRSSTDGGSTWSSFKDRNFVYSGSGIWLDRVVDTSGLNEPNSTHVQIRLGVVDFSALFAVPGNDATPAPVFDDVWLNKCAIFGPIIDTREPDLFNDAFAASGGTDVSTLAARDALDIRIDAARDIAGPGFITRGDSLVARVSSILPGVGISNPSSQITLHWILDVNPFFESSLRTNNPGIVDPGGALNGWDQFEGTVGAQQVTVNGSPIADRYFFDLPDSDFMYPGDELRYYIEAVDDNTNTTTVPEDTSNFQSGEDYDELYTMRGLPTYRVGNPKSTTGNQPAILFVNDFGFRTGAEEEYDLAFDQNSLQRGIDYDIYSVNGANSCLGNGIGGAANVDQIGGYNTIFYEAGDLTDCLLSDGTGTAGNSDADDIALLTAWHDLAGDRYIAYFADNIAEASSSSQALIYLDSVMGIASVASNVKSSIDNQTAPLVVPIPGTNFSEVFVAFGGPPGRPDFDYVVPETGAVRLHEFADASGGAGGYPAAASVSFYNSVTSSVDVTFPYGFASVWNDMSKSGRSSSRSILLGELLDYFQRGDFGGPTGAVPPTEAFLSPVRISPNPFNPSTGIRFSLGAATRASVRIYNLRGERV